MERERENQKCARFYARCYGIVYSLLNYPPQHTQGTYISLLEKDKQESNCTSALKHVNASSVENERLIFSGKVRMICREGDIVYINPCLRVILSGKQKESVCAEKTGRKARDLQRFKNSLVQLIYSIWYRVVGIQGLQQEKRLKLETGLYYQRSYMGRSLFLILPENFKKGADILRVHKLLLSDKYEECG